MKVRDQIKSLNDHELRALLDRLPEMVDTAHSVMEKRISDQKKAPEQWSKQDAFEWGKNGWKLYYELKKKVEEERH